MSDESKDVTPNDVDKNRELVLKCLSPAERMTIYNILIMSDKFGDDVPTVDEEEALKGPQCVAFSDPSKDIEAILAVEPELVRMVAMFAKWRQCDVCGKMTPHHVQTGKCLVCQPNKS